MIIPIQINLKRLFRKGKQYVWPKPAHCPACHNATVWGHGFVEAYFDPFEKPLFLKRYRCPNCRKVFCCRPTGYFSRFQASIHDIRASIVLKHVSDRWLRVFSRSRQRHWYRALLRRIAAYFGQAAPDPVSGFDAFMLKGLIPVSRSI